VHSGYLYVETHDTHPGLVRLGMSERAPDPHEPGMRHVRHITRFNDVETAMMHAHELLRRQLQDLDSRLYSCDLFQAVATVESLGLKHRRVYLDPNLDEASLERIRALTRERVRGRRRRARFFQMIGYLAALLFLVQILTSFR